MLGDSPATLTDAGNRAFLDGDLTTALEYYDEAIQLYPANYILYSNRSAILLRLKRFQESLDNAEQSLKLNPKWAKVSAIGYLRKGDALRGTGNFNKAIFAYCQGLTIECGRELMAALKDTLCHSSVRDRISTLLDDTENKSDEMEPFIVISIIGQEYLNMHCSAEAIALLQLALNMDTAGDASCKLRLSVLGALSLAYYQQKNYRKAIEYLEMQLDVSEQLGEAEKQLDIHKSIANIAVLNDEVALAAAHVEKQIEIMLSNGKDSSALRIYLCDLYIELGRFQSAARLLATVGATSFQATLEIVKLALAKNDAGAALTYCNKLKETSSTPDESCLGTILKCKCLLLRKETAKALNILRRTVARRENGGPSPEIVGQCFGILSECHLALREYYTARKWAKKELKIATGIGSIKLEADALRNLSNVYQAVDDYANAVTLWRKYCSIISDRSIGINLPAETRLKSLHRLAELSQNCGRFEEAETALKQRLKLAQKIDENALIIDAHAFLYQFYRTNQKKENAKKHLEQAQKLFAEQEVVERQSLIIELSGDCSFDCCSFEEAIEDYNRCLMLVQEEGDLQKEAEICQKLGDSHWALYHADEALAYYQQSLAVCQQISDLKSMMELYSAMANVHFSKGTMEECHSCLRCYLTIDSLLSKNAASLGAFILIGRTLLLRSRHKEAKKIFTKALNLTTESNNRRERGLLHGYIAECYVGMGDKIKKQPVVATSTNFLQPIEKKAKIFGDGETSDGRHRLLARTASFNFCKQIAYFDDIDDTEGKCETLRHLIEEKRMISDSDWAIRLCRSRIDLSQMGSVDLQVQVLKESAEVAESLSEPSEACKFLEKAVMLCVAHKCNQIMKLLSNLSEKYLKCGARKRAVTLFRECLDATEVNSEEHNSMLVELGKLELQEGLTRNAITHVVQAKEGCQDRSMKASCEYILACAYYASEDYKNALYHMQNSISLLSGGSQLHSDKSELELALVEWHCSESDRAIKKIQDIAMKSKISTIHRVLDECCLYDLLNHEKVSKISAIHWMMTRGDFITAKRLFDLHKNAYQNSLEYVADLILFYWHDLKIAKCAEFLEEYLNVCCEECPEMNENLSLIPLKSRRSALVDFLYATLISSKYMMHADAMEAVTIAELKFWRSIQRRKYLTKYSPPNLQSTRERIESLEMSLLYCLQVDHHKLIWKFSPGHDAELMHFTVDNTAPSKLPLFYAQFMDRILSSCKNITVLNSDKFEQLIDDSQLLVNIEGVANLQKTHMVSFHEPSYEGNRKEPEIGILCAGFDSDIISCEHVDCNERSDFINKAQLSSLVIIDLTTFLIDTDSILNCDMNADVIILLDTETDETTNLLDNARNEAIRNFRIAGVGCLLDIRQQSPQSFLPFLQELISGKSVEDCLGLLEGINARLFGNRRSRIRSGLAQQTRRAVFGTQIGSPDGRISENDQRELHSFRGLPTKMQSLLLNLMNRQAKSNEIQKFFDEMEDIYEQRKSAAVAFPETIDLQHPFSELTHHEQSDTLQFVQRLFRDHLHSATEDTPAAKMGEHLNELIQSLAIKIRATKKRQRRRKRWRAQGFCSDGENSRRSSMSENTDSEAAIVDIKFDDSE